MYFNTRPLSRDLKLTKRRKVNHACLYCRRSHMTCDEGRPCQRCIKREIGHLCHDEPKHKPSTGHEETHTPTGGDSNQHLPTEPSGSGMQGPPDLPFSFGMGNNNRVPMDNQWTGMSQSPLLFQPPNLGNSEFSVLSEFLESLDDKSFINSQNPPFMPGPRITPFSASPGSNMEAGPMSQMSEAMQVQQQQQQQQQQSQPQPHTEHVEVLPAATKTERFLLTAADQEDGPRDERLTRVIHAKYEAGLLKPFNYVKGYARLSRWMETNVSPEARQQILQPLSILRPKFRAIAQSLTDIDLVFIEEAFERLLLDYDRVFSAMGIPACLWRRTGEIYKGNKEFADLVGVDVSLLRDGQLCIYELMSEEAACNYWERYGMVAFDPNQKAVLTSCVLRYKPLPSSFIGASSTSSAQGTPGPPKPPKRGKDAPKQVAFINCCFSFTIRRDTWGIPTLIAGGTFCCLLFILGCAHYLGFYMW
ncbi:hypothetical protein BOTBODRAFT_69322 [Botryobasidium botryosum FD-172 SS1]|uniref:Zn(2)-C6 fungal-type domain-containing protein n=1 Tax=Botryobasidium botryosum (strain FD-172 SS1) TaxID=930990 RepID=A0A067M0F5_BOTB1|nr:hypothetical protein BOTBODRAFT_69322 [Botryobasidium botryosum FD-172 SS1]